MRDLCKDQGPHQLMGDSDVTRSRSARIIPHRDGKLAAAGARASCPAHPAGEELAADLAADLLPGAASDALLNPLLRPRFGCFSCPDFASGLGCQRSSL